MHIYYAFIYFSVLPLEPQIKAAAAPPVTFALRARGAQRSVMHRMLSDMTREQNGGRRGA